MNTKETRRHLANTIDVLQNLDGDLKGIGVPGYSYTRLSLAVAIRSAETDIERIDDGTPL